LIEDNYPWYLKTGIRTMSYTNITFYEKIFDSEYTLTQNLEKINYLEKEEI
jgi:hypothetical protein